MIHTVLLVEDEEDLRESMRDALEFNGYAVVAAHDGKEALDAMDRIEQICVVILDLVRPVMDGWEFFECMRARPEFARVPVVVHTSASNHAPAGATRVIQKPLELTGLLSVVREYCAA